MFKKFFKKKQSMRVLPDQSTREIADAKTRLGTELRAAIYLYNEDKFIVCSIAGISEFGDPVVLDANVTDEELGLALCDKLLEFQSKTEQDLSKLKLDDWAAYKVSGAKTGKAFEQKCIYLYVRTVNSAINIEAAPRLSNERELRALCTISNGRKHSEVGAAIRKAISAATLLRDAGML